ncbi:hypothetical protein BCIN_06g06230 [Botrytis cinerea B05.10]|uniref:Uncharacterized protein n=1 Tax=Botryotinia fuckeliana (strain B05.10) TaxID=332648 RepID=A0A384JL50_BOTFB|nr:hypothetical protein BCIN_06g06230 [Botrytis cinerea B05.10]ATZ51201.1 hypothetical protein BCIN_06g06230 [Botrytis cinerea B05.10]
MPRTHVFHHSYNHRSFDSYGTRGEDWTGEETHAPIAGLDDLYPLAGLIKDVFVFGFGGGGVRVVVRARMRIIFGVLVLIAGGGLVEGTFLSRLGDVSSAAVLRNAS